MINIGILQAILRLKDTMSPSLLKASKVVKKAGTTFSAAGRALLPLSIGFALVAGAAVKFAADFDSAMVKSLAIMGDLGTTTDAAFNEMRDVMETTAREVAKTTIFSAEDAAESYFFLASAGLDATASIAALKPMAVFAQAGMFDMATATDLLTDAQSALGLTIRDSMTGMIEVEQTMINMVRVSDVLVKANTLANASVEQFSVALTTKAGTSLKLFGKSVEEGVAVLAAFADQGIKAERGGTALSIIMRDLSTKAIKNADEFEKMGVAVFDSAGEFRNMADVIADLENVTDGMSDKMKKATLLQLGFADRSVTNIQALLGLSDQIRRYQTELEKAGGITEEVAEKQLKSFSAQLGLLGSHLKDVFISLGDKLMPVIINFAKALTPVVNFLGTLVEWFGKLPGPVQAVGVAFTLMVVAAGPLLMLIGSMSTGLAALLGFAGFAGVGAAATAAAGAIGFFLTTILPWAAIFAGVLSVAFKFTKWALEITGLRSEFDTLADSIFGVTRAIKEHGGVGGLIITDSKQTAQAMHNATLIAKKLGTELPKTFAEAQKILTEHNMRLREAGGFTEELTDKQKAELLVLKELEPQFKLVALAIEDIGGTIQTVNDLKIEELKLWHESTAATKEHTSAMNAEQFIVEQNLKTLVRWTNENEAATWSLQNGASSLKAMTSEQAEAFIATQQTTTAMDRLRDSLEFGAHFAELFGQSLANAFTGLGTMLSGIDALSFAIDDLRKKGGDGGFLSGLFDTGGKGALGGILNIFGNIASLLGPIGALVGPVVKWFKGLFGRSKGDVQKDVRRTMGVAISDGLAQAILDSGKRVEFFLSDMFSEGALDIDQLSEQIGNIFSRIFEGVLTEGEGIQALEAVIPSLIENFESLGTTGQEQVERIIFAALELGVPFDGLGELMGLRIADLIELGGSGEAEIQRIIAAAEELGIEIEGLGEILQSAFAPDTMEEIAKQFDLTNDQVRELADQLGVDLQTDLERMSATLGISVEEARALAAAMDIPVEDLEGLLEAMGITAQEAAEALGIDLGPLEDSASNVADETQRSAENATTFANEVERAARAWATFDTVTFPSAPLPPGFAHGGHVDANPPFGTTIRVGEREGETIIPDSLLSGGGGGGESVVHFNITGNTFTGEPQENADAIIQAVKDGLRNDGQFRRMVGRAE